MREEGLTYRSPTGFLLALLPFLFVVSFQGRCDFERINRQQPGTENILGHLLFFIVLLFAARSSSSSSRVLPTLAPLFLAQRVLEAQRWAKLSNEFACRSPNDFLLSEERTRPSSRSSIKEMTLNKISPVPPPISVRDIRDNVTGFAPKYIFSRRAHLDTKIGPLFLHVPDHEVQRYFLTRMRGPGAIS